MRTDTADDTTSADVVVEIEDEMDRTTEVD